MTFAALARGALALVVVAPAFAQCTPAWTTPAPGGLNDSTLAMVVHNDGSGPALFVGGNFGTAGTGAASRVAKWNGSAWSNLGSGVNSTVSAMTVFDDGSGAALYVGGSFSTAGGGAANRIAKGSGRSWSPG